MNEKPRLVVIGAGMGDPDLLTGRARREIMTAEQLFAPPRLAEAMRALNPRVQAAGWQETLAALEAGEGNAAVLVSGDAGFFSLSAPLAERLGGRYRIEWVSGLNTLQALCGRLGQRYENAPTLSLHGRPGALHRLAGLAAYHETTLVLAGSGEDVARALDLLRRCGIPGLTVALAERLSAPDERLREGPPESLEGPFDPLSALLVRNPAPADPCRRLRDGDFARGEAPTPIPMTKEAVRVLIANKLELRPDDLIWDVGAGTGAASALLALAAREGLVLAVEREPRALALIRENRARLGTWNLLPVEGIAPDALEPLPAPNAVFVGGGGAALPAVLDQALGKNPAARVCVSAVTLETLHLAVSELERRGMVPEVECVQVSRAEPTGRYHLLRAQNPVYLISGRGAG